MSAIIVNGDLETNGNILFKQGLSRLHDTSPFSLLEKLRQTEDRLELIERMLKILPAGPKDEAIERSIEV